MTTKQIFASHNKQLLTKLIPNKSEPIYGNHFINPTDENFYKPLKDV